MRLESLVNQSYNSLNENDKIIIKSNIDLSKRIP